MKQRQVNNIYAIDKQKSIKKVISFTLNIEFLIQIQ